MRLIISIWNWLSNLGIHEGLSYIETSRIKISNQLSFLWAVVLFSIYLKLLFIDGITAIYATNYSVLLLLTMLFFNSTRNYNTARIVVFGGFPLIVFYAITLFGRSLGIEFAFIILMIAAIIFFEKKLFKIGLVLLNLILYIYSQHYILNNPPPLAWRIDFYTTIIIFVVCSLTLVIFVTYITQEYKKSLQRKNDFLNTLELQNKKLLLAYDEIEQFTYMASHDLKTPLRVIISFIGLLELKKKQPFTGDEAIYFGMIKDQANHMNELINDILEYSQLSKKEDLKMEKVDVTLTVKKVLDQIKVVSDKKINLQLANIPDIISNPTFINLLIKNILENAVKYNTNEVVDITIFSSIENNLITLSFKDNGIGIDEIFHEQIFDIFKRLHTTDQYSGSGIGLAICKKIVAKLNGEISLESKIDEGATFSIKLPLNFTKDPFLSST